MFQVESFWLKVQSSECGLPDFVIQAGLPDFVIQAGLPDFVIQAGVSPAVPIATCWRAFVTRVIFLPSTCTN